MIIVTLSQKNNRGTIQHRQGVLKTGITSFQLSTDALNKNQWSSGGGTCGNAIPIVKVLAEHVGMLL